MKQRFLFFVLLLVVGLFPASSLLAQVAGDYGSAGTGNWGTTATWVVFVAASDWSDATAAPGAPSATKNVFIRNGHTVTVDASSKTCKNLTVQSGGTLLTSAIGNTLTASGDIQIDGVFGSNTAGILVQFAVTGKIFGSGTCYFSKIRANLDGITMTVDMDAIGSAGGAASSFINCNGKNNVTFEVKAGRTVTLPVGCYVSVASTSSTSDPGTGGNFTINIYGTLTAPVVSGGGVNLANLATFTTTLNIFNGGTLNTGRLSALATTTAAACNININSGGTLVLTHAITNDAGKASVVVDGIFTCDSSISVAFGTATVSSTGKLRLRSAAYPTGTVNLNTGSTVEYFGTAGISMAASPATYENLTINNVGGVTLSGPITVNSVLTLAAGLLDNSVNQVTLGPSGSVNNTGGSISQTPLPVELTSFVGKAHGRTVELQWQTATEIDNSGFEVQKNVNGSWAKIGFVDGAGTTSMHRSYSFVDVNSAAQTYSYRLKQIDHDGKFEYSGTVEVTTTLTAEDFKLSQNYPNPFNPSTKFSFAMKNAEHTTVKIYNLVGEEVATLFNDVAQPGQMYTMTFDAKNLSSGIYFYVLRSATRNEVKKMMLMK